MVDAHCPIESVILLWDEFFLLLMCITPTSVSHTSPHVMLIVLGKASSSPCSGSVTTPVQTCGETDAQEAIGAAGEEVRRCVWGVFEEWPEYMLHVWVDLYRYLFQYN